MVGGNLVGLAAITCKTRLAGGPQISASKSTDFCIWTNLSQLRGGLPLQLLDSLGGLSRVLYPRFAPSLSLIPWPPGHPPSSPPGQASVYQGLRSASESIHLLKHHSLEAARSFCDRRGRKYRGTRLALIISSLPPRPSFSSPMTTFHLVFNLNIFALRGLTPAFSRFSITSMMLEMMRFLFLILTEIPFLIA